MRIEVITGLKFIPCHRLPERSPHICGHQFPLCYRCLFIILGYGTVPVFWLSSWFVPLYIGALLNIPMLVDGYTQYRKMRKSNNFLRCVTGLCSGIGQAMCIVDISFYLTSLLGS